METMNTTIETTATIATIDTITKQVFNALCEFREEGDLLYNARSFTDYGIRQNVKEWFCEKEVLLDTFRKHPNWSEKDLAIIGDLEYKIEFDAEYIKAEIQPDINDFFYKIRNGYWSYFVKEYTDWYTRFNCENSVIDFSMTSVDSVISAVLFGENGNDIESTISEWTANYLNDKRMITYNHEFRKGMKKTKVIEKIFKPLKLEEIKSIQHKEWYDDQNEFHSVDKEISPWEQLKAKLFDAMNPKTVKLKYSLSINPMDYLLMSNGISWKSCHTILDGGSDAYHGCYMGGTLSYMNDKHAVIFSIIGNSDMELTQEAWKYQKIERQVFLINAEEMYLFQQRLYPQSNDYNPILKAKTTAYRKTVENILAVCAGVKSSWVKTKRFNVSSTRAYAGYEDFSQYTRMSNAAYLKNVSEESEIEEDSDNVNSERRDVRFVVGGTSYCIECGKPKDIDDFYDEENFYNGILCNDCHSDEDGRDRCECCGERTDDDDMTYVEDYGYVCNYCLEQDDRFHYCEYHEQYEYERYSDDWYYIEDYGYVCSDGYSRGDFCYCDCCENYREGNNYVRRNAYGITVCDYCYDNETIEVTCAECGQVEDVTYREYDEEGYENYNYICEECLKKGSEEESETLTASVSA